MAAPLAVINHGRPGFWDGPVRKGRQLRSLDTLSGTWISDFPDALKEGMPAPDWPGMIIDNVEEEQDAGSFRYRVQAVGSLSNDRPDKIVGNRQRRSLEGTFDEAGRDYLTWRHAEMPATGATATNFISCPNHRFANGDVIWFSAKTGGSGVTIRTDYHVRDATSAGFKLAATAGGSVHALGSDISAATIVLKIFARGSRHPDMPNMVLMEVNPQDGATDWGQMNLGYRGLIGSKPYQRTMTLEASTISGVLFIATSLFPGGWDTARDSQIDIPRMVIEDIEVATELPDFTAAPASDTPPPDPPDINLDFGLVSGEVTSFWPNEWAYKGLRVIAQIPGTTICIIARRWEYVFPVMVKG